MPKKHAPSYTHTKPSYVHPSLQSSRSASSSAPAEPQTVTQRIQQLRREQTPRASSSRRDEVTEIVSSRTLPKQVRQVLHMAEVDSPPPKPGNRTSRAPRRGGARPPPGPAAPSSWLQTSRHAPPHIRNLKKYRTGGDMGPARFCALAQVHDAEYKRLPPPRSLVHHCLKTLASHWEDLVEYEQHYLHELPVPLKEALLSYLTIYGARDCLDMRSLKTLFSNNPEGEGHNGAEDIRFLDLTGLLRMNEFHARAQGNHANGVSVNMGEDWLEAGDVGWPV
ncbi:hypothetical protein K491DRAFT_711507 [Lophiostoma macrostomum CBS 122681]|uniref:Uncharacterized protein n=1 Tax=Lophiostoma macrostomum CBS 122681 TaxID=1314788 RepID=A0A6A6TL77_9PLEO|nr:hypothetical protein K491DRAFT_711507 [Lophiostoma macrostomum CBS 122681]